MRFKPVVWSLACVIGVLFFAGAWDQSQAGPAIKASIEGRKGSCVPKNGVLVVPPGKRAVNFKRIALNSGYNCHNGFKLNHLGFSIRREAKSAGSIYSYYRNEKGKSNETGGPLSAVSLPPGRYLVIVDGGYQAVVQLTYDLR